MALKTHMPTTPGRRFLISIDRRGLWKGSPVPSLTKGLSKTGGRNNKGRITAYHRGGGHKRRYRIIDFKRAKRDMEASVVRLEYDPNRSGFIALLEYKDKTLSYILAPQDLNTGDKVMASEESDIKVGCALPLWRIPVGTVIHNVELKPGKGGQLARSAGTSVQIIGRDAGYVQLRLTSGELRSVLGQCWATVGMVSNPDQKNRRLGKAGRNRWLGRRPVVRGSAMNPVDHPHGGGEGKSKGGRHPVTPWGVATKGKRTRHNPATDRFIIRRRPQKRKKR